MFRELTDDNDNAYGLVFSEELFKQQFAQEAEQGNIVTFDGHEYIVADVYIGYVTLTEYSVKRVNWKAVYDWFYRNTYQFNSGKGVSAYLKDEFDLYGEELDKRSCELLEYIKEKDEEIKASQTI